MQFLLFLFVCVCVHLISTFPSFLAISGINKIAIINYVGVCVAYCAFFATLLLVYQLLLLLLPLLLLLLAPAFRAIFSLATATSSASLF